MVEAFASLVEQNFRSEHGIEFYATKLRTTPKALAMRVSRSSMGSARAMIHSQLLAEAKRLLAYSRLSLAEVGFEVGFTDPGHFSRF